MEFAQGQTGFSPGKIAFAPKKAEYFAYKMKNRQEETTLPITMSIRFEKYKRRSKCHQNLEDAILRTN